MKMAVIVLIAIKANQIRKLRRADRRAKLSAERGIRAGFLNRDAEECWICSEDACSGTEDSVRR